MTTYPSHKNSNNERNERRANWKADMSRKQTREELTQTVAARFKNHGAKTVEAGLVTREGSDFYIKAGKRHYSVRKIGETFVCECRDNEKFGDCVHRHAAQIFAGGAN